MEARTAICLRNPKHPGEVKGVADGGGMVGNNPKEFRKGNNQEKVGGYLWGVGRSGKQTRVKTR